MPGFQVANPDNGGELKKLKEFKGGKDKDGSDRVTWYPCARRYSRRELIADGIVNVLGVILALAFSPLMIIAAKRQGQRQTTIDGLIVFCVCMCGMLTFSCLFNSFARKETWFPYLQFLDMVGINLMVAGSYTPVCIFCKCYTLLGLVYTLAAMGILWQVLNFGVPSSRRVPVDLVLFLCMGWSCLPFSGAILEHFSSSAIMYGLTFGGLFTVGAMINAWEALEFHKPIWHVCVVSATAIEYVLFMREVAYGDPS
eukprot:TRINITY_DN54033_c0_g1_i1.p1 TRINITY_DN54033_c0_g1~~TRINITY_DN54033_c0_g1_i1.p1  ORF type:complete len:255 (+),score=48.28 TRINITY_DN54033_c0_g1_i1:320-1084(+)